MWIPVILLICLVLVLILGKRSKTESYMVDITGGQPVDCCSGLPGKVVKPNDPQIRPYKYY